MGKITVEDCIVDGVAIEGLKVITPTVFGDDRGYFMETYNENDMKAAGMDYVFVQDNQSASKKGVLRGLHFQKEFPQDKLVRVVNGEVFDVAVDLRAASATFGKWYGVLLSAERSTPYHLPKVALPGLRSTATSNTSPLTTLTSLSCGNSFWK